MPIIPGLRKPRQDGSQYKASLDYILSIRQPKLCYKTLFQNK